MKYLTSPETSEKWGISSRRISLLCAEGRIEGAIKKGKTWLIPSDTQKPADARYRDNKKQNRWCKNKKKDSPGGIRNGYYECYGALLYIY